MSKKQWTREACYEEAKKYKTRNDFRKGCISAYNAAWRNGWLDDYYWFENGYELEGKKRKMWDYEACKKVVMDCTNKTELQKKYGRAYNVIRENGWYELFEGLISSHKKWPYEDCKKAVEDCTTKTELKKKWPGAYMAIKTNGWHELFEKLVDRRKFVSKEVAQKRAKKITKWTKPECMKAALKCKTLAEFQRDYPKEYRASYKHGWLPEFTWLEKNVPEKNVCIYAYIFPDLKTVYVGLTNNTKRRDKDHRRDFKNSKRDKTSAVYKFCQKNNLDTPNMTILKRDLPAETEGRYWEDYYFKKYKTEGWTLLNIAPTGSNASIGNNAAKITKEECYRLSLDCTSRSEFDMKHHREYQKSWREGWLDEFEHLKPKVVKWTNDLIWNEVYKHNSCAEFHKLSRNAYNAAWTRNMLPEIKAYYAQKKRA